jgi:hypothetical protein
VDGLINWEAPAGEPRRQTENRPLKPGTDCQIEFRLILFRFHGSPRSFQLRDNVISALLPHA